jgi:hypothetical protein
VTEPMKHVILLLVCALIAGCSTTRKTPPRTVLRQVDSVLAGEHRAPAFELRLDELGAQIAKGPVPEERIATIALPGKPGYFPPRTVTIVYVISDKGLVDVRSADVTSFGSKFAGSTPNKAASANP